MRCCVFCTPSDKSLGMSVAMFTAVTDVPALGSGLPCVRCSIVLVFVKASVLNSGDEDSGKLILALKTGVAGK